MRRHAILTTTTLALLACGGEPDIFGQPAAGGGDEGGSTSSGPGAGGSDGGGPTTSSGGAGGAGATTTTAAGGEGGTPPCFLGERSCLGEDLHTCDEQGQWQFLEHCPASGTSCVVDACEKDLRLRLRFEEGSGLQTVDDAQGLVGTLGGSPAWSAGYAGGAVDFAPSTEGNFGNVLNSLSLPVTITAWVKVDPGADDYMIVLATDTSSQTGYAGVWLAIDASAGNLVTVGFGNGGGTGPNNRNGKTSAYGLDSGVWNHVAAAYYGWQNATIWVNGVDVGGSYSGGATTMAFTSGHLSVGRGTWGGADLPFDGVLDEVRVYDRALTGSQVLDLLQE